MASLRDFLDEDLNVDTVLQQYMLDIESCTNDLSQAPPSLQDLSPLSMLQQPTVQQPTSTADAGLAQQPLAPLSPGSSGQLDSSGRQADMLPACNASTGSKRTEAWAAKNRRAQQRFRERQKASIMTQALAVDIVNDMHPPKHS